MLVEVTYNKPSIFTVLVMSVRTQFWIAWYTNLLTVTVARKTELAGGDCVLADNQGLCNSCKAPESTKSRSNAEHQLD